MTVSLTVLPSFFFFGGGGGRGVEGGSVTFEISKAWNSYLFSMKQ